MLSPVTEEYNDPHLSVWFIKDTASVTEEYNDAHLSVWFNKGTAFLITYCDL